MRAVVLFAVALPACAPDRPGCLDDPSPDCMPPSPCEALEYTCEGGFVRAYRMTDPAERSPGLDAIGAPGDYVLENEHVKAVLDAPESPHCLATGGGFLLDLAAAGGGDHLNQAMQITGILPRDAPEYDVAEIHEDAGSASVVVRGALAGDSRVVVVTRYELRPCDPGVRIRTEIWNGGRDVGAWFLADAYYWGDRETTPFVPLEGQGFHHPELDLIEIDESFRTFPFMAAQGHGAPPASYSTVACDRRSLDGIHSATVSAAGAPRRVVLPGDGLALERIVFVAGTPDVGGAQSLAMDARSRLFGEAYDRVSGTVTTSDGTPRGGDEREASVLVYEPGRGDPDDPETIVPWTEVVPADDGTFQAIVPRGRDLRIQAHALGRPVGSAVAAPAGSTDVAIELPAEARLTVGVSDVTGVDPAPTEAEIILVPADEGSPESVPGTVHGFFDEGCAPYLGPPHGAAPACNRALTDGAVASFDVAPGHYFVYAAAGPEASLGKTEITLAPGAAETVDLEIERFGDLRPAGSLAADFHVHSGRSFDSAFPLEDRVRTFVAAGLDVLVATDHDVVTSYDDAIDAIGARGRLVAISGVETTGHVPWFYAPGSEFPAVVGHFNFWPMPFDDTAPRAGMPWDELREPGELYDLFAPLLGPHGVRQLNHPLDDAELGRDTGWLTAISWAPGDPLPDVLVRAPGGGRRNIDHDAQEVMNGARILRFLRYRIAWHTLLSEGILRTGTANSDTHGLAIEAAGYPHDVVLGVGSLAVFDPDLFDDAVKAGRLFGTNGPMLDVSIGEAGPSLAPIVADPGASLAITVRAAPWVPVEEVRVIVNGAVAATFEVPASTETLRFEDVVSLADLGVTSDAWIVVEAGLPLPEARDTDDDGLPDFVDGNGDGVFEEEDLDPARPGDPRFDYDVVTRGGWPTAFANPFVVDVDGDGWEAPGA